MAIVSAGGSLAALGSIACPVVGPRFVGLAQPLLITPQTRMQNAGAAWIRGIAALPTLRACRGDWAGWHRFLISVYSTGRLGTSLRISLPPEEETNDEMLHLVA